MSARRRDGRRLSGLCAMVLAVLPGVSGSFAEAPKIDSLFPAGGKRGTEFEVTATGKVEPWPLMAICDQPRVSFSPDEKVKGKYRVKIDGDAPVGPCLVWFSNRDGATAPRQFVVGEHAERTQNGSELMVVPAAQLPLTVNGKLESGGDVDRFAIELEAGQTLVASVTAYAIDSPMDSLLHLCGPGGERLAFNHDATRLGLDPRLVFEAPAAGKYELQLSAFAHPPQANIRFAGGATSIYRLALGHEVPAIDLPEPFEPQGEGAAVVGVPASISGRIEVPGDVDRFQFAASKGEVFQIRVIAAEIGSWMDALLVLEDVAGKELKREDDIDRKTQPDVALDWKAPADGEFVAKVMDLNGAAGAEIAYRFQIEKQTPGFSGSASRGVYALAAGGQLEIAVQATRSNGYGGELEIGLDGLPPGVSAAPAAVPEKGGEVKVSLSAGPDVRPATVPISIWIAPKGAAPEGRRRCAVELKGSFADAGDLLINSTDRAWLTVLESTKK